MKHIKYLLLSFVCLSAVHAAHAQNYIYSLSPGTNTFQSGTYVIGASITHRMQDFSNNYHGPAIRIAPNSTVTFIMQKGISMTLTGSHAVGDKLAYPAIELPETSRLIIKGEGQIFATGGNGLSPQNGAAGSNGSYSCHDWARGGNGGSGGKGGNGSAPGIGTPGAMGGDGGTTVACPQKLSRYKMEGEENRGGSGKAGCTSDNMGKLFVLGNIKIVSNRGNVGFTETKASSGSSALDRHKWRARDNFSGGGGGGGGQGGASMTSKYGIGAGGPGAGGGGAGGSGGIDDEYWFDNLDYFFGYGGEGGKSSAGNGGTGKRGWEKRDHSAGGLGGYGGASGEYGNNGFVYYTFNTSFESNGCESVDPKNSQVLKDDSSIDLIPSDMRNSINGATWNGKEKAEFYCGMALVNHLAKVDIPKSPKPNSNFKGYFDQFGNQIYDGNGNINIVFKDKSQNSIYQKDINNNWYVNLTTDIQLTPLWSDSVYLVVRHLVENPNYVANDSADQYNDHLPAYYETRGFEFAEGEQKKIVLKKFCDIDGKRIDALLSQDETSLPASDRRYRIAEGESEQTEVTIGSSSMVVVDQKYDCNSFNLTWNLNGKLTEKEFNSLLINKSSYTPAGKYKYGCSIVRPELRSLKGKHIRNWSPVDKYSMEAGGISFTPIEVDTTYCITQNVDKGDTNCDISLSKLKGIKYDEEVRIDIRFSGDTRVKDLKIETVNGGKNVECRHLNDSTYSFSMPDDDVNISISFVYAHYGLMTSVSNRSATKVALQGNNGLYYTDDNDYFKFDSSSYGGKLADFEVYQNQKLNVLAEIDYSVLSEEDSSTGSEQDVNEVRPLVQIHCGNREYDEHVIVDNAIINGKMRRFYSYTIGDATNICVKVIWLNRVNKKIDFNMPFNVKVSSIYSDLNPNVMIEGNKGAVACLGDCIFFTVETDDSTFNHDNIAVSYIDATGIQRFEPLRTYNESNSKDSAVYSFLMPDRNVVINCYVGEKIPVSAMLPTTGASLCKASDDGADEFDGYKIILPEYAVKGSIVPFFIPMESNEDFAQLNNPLALYVSTSSPQVDRLCTTGSVFNYFDCFSNDDIETIGQGAFVVPENADKVVLKNGRVLPIDADALWFTFAVNEPMTLPDWIEAYTITTNTKHEYELSKIQSGSIGEGGYMFHICPDKLYLLPEDEDNSFDMFIPTDPNLLTDPINNNNELCYVSSETTGQQLHNYLSSTTGFDYSIYVFDHDVDKDTYFFRKVTDDETIPSWSVYLPILDDGSGLPYYDTGIQQIVSDGNLQNGNVYDLRGINHGTIKQNIEQQLKKGVYILSGKKYIVE